ncbi:MAG: hypothetical protein RR056_05195 [Acetivibrio sp.]
MIIQENQKIGAMDACYKSNMCLSLQPKTKITGSEKEEAAVSLQISKEGKTKFNRQNISEDEAKTVQDVIQKMRKLSSEAIKKDVSVEERFLIQEKMKELKIRMQEVNNNKSSFQGKRQEESPKEFSSEQTPSFHLNICL